MKKEIVINSTANEHRIAILEDGKLAELFVETPGKERMVGDIHLGKVAKVMPGIRAAFIDIGLQQDAFLHFSDIGSSLSEYNALFEDDDDDDEMEDPTYIDDTNEVSEVFDEKNNLLKLGHSKFWKKIKVFFKG